MKKFVLPVLVVGLIVATVIAKELFWQFIFGGSSLMVSGAMFFVHDREDRPMATLVFAGLLIIAGISVIAGALGGGGL